MERSELLNSLLKAVPKVFQKYADVSIPFILDVCEEEKVVDTNQISYILATTLHESGMGKYMVEIWGKPPTSYQVNYEGNSRLGNDQPGDGFKYRGRGFCQITGKSNYRYWEKEFGIDFVSNPELMSDPNIAAKVLVRGMRDGRFTGKKLSDYINDKHVDFFSARKIINGLYKADLFQQAAESFVKAFNYGGSIEEK